MLNAYSRATSITCTLQQQFRHRLAGFGFAGLGGKLKTSVASNGFRTCTSWPRGSAGGAGAGTTGRDMLVTATAADFRSATCPTVAAVMPKTATASVRLQTKSIRAVRL